MCQPFLPVDMSRKTAWDKEIRTEEPCESPRDICLTAASRIVQLISLLRNATANRLGIALNLHQNALVLAAVVLLFEATAPADSGGAADQQRRAAHGNLQECLAYLEEIAKYKPAARDALTNLRQLLADRQVLQAQYNANLTNSRQVSRRTSPVSAQADSSYLECTKVRDDRAMHEGLQSNVPLFFPTYEDILLSSTSPLNTASHPISAQASSFAFPFINYTAAAAPWDEFLSGDTYSARDPLAFLGFDFTSEGAQIGADMLFRE